MVFCKKTIDFVWTKYIKLWNNEVESVAKHNSVLISAGWYKEDTILLI